MMKNIFLKMKMNVNNVKNQNKHVVILNYIINVSNIMNQFVHDIKKKI